MQRDMDLIRLLLLMMETPKAQRCDFYEKQLESKYTPEQISYHQYLLHDAGLAEGCVVNTDLGLTCDLTYLTWAGHDFLEAAREPARWEKAKTIFGKMGGVTLDMAKAVLTNLITEQAKRLMGM